MMIMSKAVPVSDPVIADATRNAVLGVLNALPAGTGCNFDAVRKQVGMDAKALPDGTIHQIALDAGFEVA